MKPLVAVLAGGASTRMGSDKAQVDIDGVTMLDRLVAVAGSLGDLIVVGDSHPDLRPGGLGPLAGLETALAAAAGRDVVLLGVDQPFLRPETLEHLLAISGDAVVPFDEGWEQVTCAVYREGCLQTVSLALDQGERSIITVLDDLDTVLVGPEHWRSWGEDGRSWFSVNTPEALIEGLERFG